MPTIYRCSAQDFALGNFQAGPGAVAIRITDPAATLHELRTHFVASHHFEFTDVESESEITGEFAITAPQADQIAAALLAALNAGHDVVVHCNQGIYRSGAVAEAATMLGFVYTNPLANGRFNRLVRRQVIEALARIQAARILSSIEPVTPAQPQASRFDSLVAAGITSEDEVQALHNARITNTLSGREQTRNDVLCGLAALFKSFESKERRF